MRCPGASVLFCLSPPLVALFLLARLAIRSGQSHPGSYTQPHQPGSGRRATALARSSHSAAMEESAPSATSAQNKTWWQINSPAPQAKIAVLWCFSEGKKLLNDRPMAPANGQSGADLKKRGSGLSSIGSGPPSGHSGFWSGLHGHQSDHFGFWCGLHGHQSGDFSRAQITVFWWNHPPKT